MAADEEHENAPGERQGVSPPVPRHCTGKLTHAAHQLFHTNARGVYLRNLGGFQVGQQIFGPSQALASGTIVKATGQLLTARLM